MSTPSGSRQPHVSSYSDTPDYRTALIDKLQRKTTKLQYDNENLETTIAGLRSANVKFEDNLSDASQTIVLRDSRLASLKKNV